MKTVGTVVVALLVGLTTACTNAVPGAASTDDEAVTAARSGADSIGCGDGKKSTPNVWFASIGASAKNAAMVHEVALMSSNLFSVDSVTAINPATDDGSLAYPVNVDAATSLVFEVSFTPGNDSIAFPTIHADSIANRDKVLTELKNRGVAIDCNTIIHAQPLGVDTGEAAAKPVSDVDSLGCGDGTKSAPNAWLMSISKCDANSALFHEIALMSSNLFGVGRVVAPNPKADVAATTFPSDLSGVTGLDLEVSFTLAVDSLSFPHMHADSIAERNTTLTTLEKSGVVMSCNNIGVAQPLSSAH